MASPDPVDLLCNLMDAGVETFEAAVLRNRRGDAVDCLMRIGALVSGQRLSVITCGACDEDHSVQLEFDPATRQHFHFCPEAGRVTVPDADIETIAVDPRWLIDWLMAELPIVPPARHRELVRDRAWFLGDAIVRGTSLRVVFARGISSYGDLDAVAASLPPVRRDSVGLVITTRADLPNKVHLPHAYVVLSLREIVRAARCSCRPGSQGSRRRHPRSTLIVSYPVKAEAAMSTSTPAEGAAVQTPSVSVPLVSVW